MQRPEMNNEKRKVTENIAGTRSDSKASGVLGLGLLALRATARTVSVPWWCDEAAASVLLQARSAPFTPYVVISHSMFYSSVSTSMRCKPSPLYICFEAFWGVLAQRLHNMHGAPC